MKQSRFAYSDDEGLKILSEKDISDSFKDKDNVQKGSMEDFFDQVENDLKDEINKLEKALDLFHKNQLLDQAYKIEQRIEKAKKDLSKLVKTKKFITRNGKSFLTTVYINPETGEKEEKSRVEVKEASKIKDLSIGDRFKCETRKISGEFIVQDFYREKDFATVVCRDVKTASIKYLTPHTFHSFEKLEKKVIDLTEKKIPSLSDLKYTGIVLGGSSGVKLYAKVSSDSKDLYAVKTPHKGDPNQVKQEAVISQVYRNFGLKTSKSFYDEESGVLISEYIDGAKQLGSLNSVAKQSIRKEVQKGFVLDCILANYDAVGQGEDNILVKDGEVYRIDLGGCLEYRAQGGVKHFASTALSIPFSMKEKNPIFSNIEDEQIKEQLEQIVANKKGFDVIKSLKEKDYYSTILSRLESLCIEYGVNFHKDSGDFEVIEEEKGEEKLRPDMPSLTTQKYFDEEWDKVNIEGNPGLKEHIKKHILKIEKSYDAKNHYKKIADANNISVDEVKANMQLWWSELVKRSDGYIVAHSGEKGHRVIDKILISGRFKTQFETGTSEGDNYPSGRSSTEGGYFGFPKYDTNEGESIKHLRPIYGYFSDIDNGILNKEATIPPPRNVSQYGDIAFKVKKEKFLKDATVTFIDSLYYEKDIAATPAAAPHFTSVLPVSENYNMLKTMYESHVGGDRTCDYVEAQYHNQLTVDDIESAHISLNEYKDGKDVDFRRVSNVINTITEAVAQAKKPVKIKLFQ